MNDDHDEAKTLIEDEPTHKLIAAPAVVRATIHITRKATGKVETFELVGHVPAEEAPPTTTPR